MDDDLCIGRLVEHEIRVRQHHQATNRRIVRARPDVRMKQEKIDEGLNTGLNAPGSLRRRSSDVIEKRGEIGKGWNV
jgi:hypothetical protein